MKKFLLSLMALVACLSVGAVDVANIAEFLALDNGTEVKITNPVTVFYQYGKNLYVKDATGAMLVYGNLDVTYNNGDVIPAGIEGKMSIYKNLPEFVPTASTFVAGTAGTAIEPVVTTPGATESMELNSFIKLENVSISSVNGRSAVVTGADGTTANLYNTFNNVSFTEGTDYTIVGITTVYDTTRQISVCSLETEGEVPYEEVDNIADWLTMQETSMDVTILNPVTAVFQSGKYLYLHDSTGWLLVYGQLENTYTNGDVIEGVSGRYGEYGGNPQMIPVVSSFGPGNAGTAVVSPTEVILADVNAEPLNSYVEIHDLTIGAAEGNTVPVSDESGETLNLYNRFGIEIPEGAGYTVRGFVTLYNGNYQIYATEVVNASGQATVATPVFNPAAGSIAKGTSVAISTATAGAAIYYTVDGSEPTTASAAYSEPIVVNEDVTIKAVAVKDGMVNSSVATAAYTVYEPVVGGDEVYFVAANYSNDFDNVVVLHNNNGNDEPAADDAKVEDSSCSGTVFSSEAVSIEFVHGTNEYYTTVFNNQVRFYAAESMIVTPAEGYKVVGMYFNTVANSKGDVSVSVDGNPAGTVEGTGVGASNPITWTGEFSTPATVVANKQVRFNYLMITTSSATGIEGVEATDENAPVVYYNLQGVRVANPTSGIYVRVQGNTASKVLVK